MRGDYHLFNIVTVEIITGLATVNPSAFGINTIFPKFKPALCSVTSAGSYFAGSDPSKPLLGTQKLRT